MAELTFTSLFDLRYESVNTLWPRLLKDVAPAMPRRLRTRKELARRLNAICTLRNRVFHHEPIWHWRDLAERHRAMLETLARHVRRSDFDRPV